VPHFITPNFPSLDHTRIRSFAKWLPKCEVHLHFEGAVPVELAREWAPEPIPSPASWEAQDYRFESFTGDFSQVMQLTWKDTCTSLERLDIISSRIFEGLDRQNVRYVEMSFGIGAYPYPAGETLAAFKSGVPDGMTVRIIGALSRDRDIPVIREAAHGYISCDDLDGVDIHGNEMVGDPMSFVDFYDVARERDLILKAHAGEMRGPESIEEMLDKLSVKRIEHGVRAIESDEMVQRLIDEEVTLGLCPWSNVKLGFYPDLETHPVADLHRAGVSVTINTDDPTPFCHTITDEYAWLISERSMSVQEVGEIARNGFAIGRMDEDVRRRSIEEIDQLVSEYAEA